MTLIKEIVKDEKMDMFKRIIEKVERIGMSDNIALLYEVKKDDGECLVIIINSKLTGDKPKRYLSQKMDYTAMLKLAKQYNLKIFRKVQRIIEEEK